MSKVIKHLLSSPGEIYNLPKSIKRVSLVIFMYFIAWGLLIPFLPIFFFGVLGSYAAATFVSALMFIFGTFWIFPMGEFLDRFSQKKAIGFFLLLYIPLFPFVSLIQTLFHAVIYQFYHSILATGLWSSAETYVRRHSPEKHKSESWAFFDASKVLSMMVGTIIGGFLLEYFVGLRTLIWAFPPLFVIVAFILSQKLLRHQVKDGEKEIKTGAKFKEAFKAVPWKRLYIKELSDFWKIKPLRKLWFFIIATGFFFGTQGVLLSLLSESLGASFLQIGLIYAFFLAPMIFEIPFSVLADTWSSKFILIFGMIVATLALLPMAVAETPNELFLFAFLLGVGIAMMVPTVSGKSSEFMPTEKTGELNGVYSASIGLGSIIGLLITGPLADFAGIQSVFILSAGVSLFCAVLAFFIWPYEKQENLGLIEVSRYQ